MTTQWKECNLGDVITLKRGYDLPRSQRKEGNIPVVSSSGVTGFHSEPKVSAPGVVTGRYGTLGEVFYIREDFWPLNTTLYVQDFKGNFPLFISYLLSALNLAQQNVAAAVPGVNRNYLHRLPVSIPPLPTQRKIAAILSAYDDLIENNARRIAILEEMAQLIYREWFVRFRFPGHEDVAMVDSEIGEVPEGWGVVSFTDIADVLSGGTPRTKVPEYWNGDTPFFSPKDAGSHFYVMETERTITELGLENCRSELYPPHTVFITARGTVGTVVMPAVPMAMNQSCYALRGLDGFDQYFVFLAIRSYVDQLRKKAHGAVFDTIIIDTFRALRVLRPPLTMVERLRDVITSMFGQILRLLRKNLLLRQTRDFFLPRLISGELDVAELDIDVRRLGE